MLVSRPGSLSAKTSLRGESSVRVAVQDAPATSGHVRFLPTKSTRFPSLLSSTVRHEAVPSTGAPNTFRRSAVRGKSVNRAWPSDVNRTLLPLSETQSPTKSLDSTAGGAVHPESTATVATAIPITLSTVLGRLLVIAICSSVGASGLNTRRPRTTLRDTQHRSVGEAKARVRSSAQLWAGCSLR